MSGDFIEKNINNFDRIMFGKSAFENVFRNGKIDYQFAVKHMDKLDKQKMIELLKENPRINQEDFISLYVAMQLF